MNNNENQKNILCSLAHSFFGINFDSNKKKWQLCQNFEVNSIQSDLYILCNSIICKVVISELLYNKEFVANRNETLVADLADLINTGFLIKSRLVIKKESRGQHIIFGSGTGGDFIVKLSNELKLKKEHNLKKAIAHFQSLKTKEILLQDEGKFLHKDMMPQKRNFSGEKYHFGSGYPCCTEEDIDPKKYFQILESLSDVIKQFILLLGVPQEIIFFNPQNLRYLIIDNLKIYGFQNSEVASSIEKHLKKYIPKTLELIRWI